MKREDEEAIDGRKTGHIDRPLGHELRVGRDAAGLTQEALAEMLDVSPGTIQKYEQGGVRVPASRLWQVCNLLDIDVANLFKGLPFRVEGHAQHSVAEKHSRSTEMMGETAWSPLSRAPPPNSRRIGWKSPLKSSRR